MEGFHHLDDVEREFAAHPVRATLVYGVRHLGDADAAADLVAMGEGNFFPRFGLGGPDLDVAAEAVRVGTLDGSLGAVNFDPRLLMRPDVEAHGDRGDHALAEFES